MAGTTETAPTVAEFLNAANWEYHQVGTPSDLRPFIVDGAQLTAFDERTGLSAHAWLTPGNQVVVSYEGTQAFNPADAATNPGFSAAGIATDIAIAAGTTPDGLLEAAAFARQVVSAAQASGISRDDVFVTGHSLGGIEAEYAAQQTGLGGIGFEPTGLIRSETTGGDGTNFVNVVQHGDAVANYSSDLANEGAFAPRFSAGGTGALPHYGYVAQIGDPAADAILIAGARSSSAGPVGVTATVAAYAPTLVAYHTPSVQAYSLGVALDHASPVDHAGVQKGPVLNAASYTIAQLIDATHATLSAPLAPDPDISPSHGAYAGAAATEITHGSAQFDTLLGAVHLPSAVETTIRQAIAGVADAVSQDFDGNAHGDILWRNADGGLSVWSVGGAAGTGTSLATQQNSFFASVGTDWHVSDTFDFNGDGRADILWRNDNGLLSVWDSTSGGFKENSYTDGSVGSEWRITGVGDVDGDHKDDLLWQRSGGDVSIWQSTGTGFTENTYFHGSPGADWHAVGLADFTGDGRADMLWRNTDGAVSTWSATASGFSENTYFSGVTTSWHIAGTGDFNGDGRADIVWQNDDGAISTWTSNGAGFDQNSYYAAASAAGKIVDVADFNGDGHADLLFRNDAGTLTVATADGAGFDQQAYATVADQNWSVVHHDYLLG